MKIEKTCIKCGYDDVSISHVKVGENKYNDDIQIFSEFGEEIFEDTYSMSSSLSIHTECIGIVCRTCGYSCASKTADSKEIEVEHSAYENTSIDEVSSGCFNSNILGRQYEIR